MAEGATWPGSQEPPGITLARASRQAPVYTGATVVGEAASNLDTDLFCRNVMASCKLMMICDSTATTRKVRKGTIIFSPGMPSRNVYLLHSGVAGLFRPWPGGEETLSFIAGPGNLLGLATLHDEPNLNGARAITDATVCSVKVAAWRELLTGKAERAMYLVDLLVAELLDVRYMLSLPASHRVRTRLASFLVVLARKFGCHTPKGIEIAAWLTHGVISCAVSSTRATITREIQDLRDAGLILIEGKVIIIPAVEALEDLIE